MSAIIKREINTYFSSAIGYVFLSIFYIFAGFNFFTYCLYSNSSSLTYVYKYLFTFTCFIIPILTMRLISEDKKQKTDQALYTAPIRLSSIALGKFISAIIVFTIAISITLIYALIISFFTMPDWPVVIGSFLGILLLGSALISIGMFLSSLTENQVIAAISTLGVGLFIIFMDSIASVIKNKFIKESLNSLSFNSHYQNFSLGIFNFTDIIFFLTVTALFIFLTVYVLAKKRWN